MFLMNMYWIYSGLSFKFNKNKTLMPIGLAARDTLRSKWATAYGNEINENTSY